MFSFLAKEGTIMHHFLFFSQVKSASQQQLLTCTVVQVMVEYERVRHMRVSLVNFLVILKFNCFALLLLYLT